LGKCAAAVILPVENGKPDNTGLVDNGLGLVSPSAGASTMAGFNDTSAPARFYRVQAVRPLTPD